MKKKAKLVYDYLDQSTFYKAHSDKENRSLMNVTFTTPNKDLDAKFVKESIEAGMTNLKGHRSVGEFVLLFTMQCHMKVLKNLSHL